MSSSAIPCLRADGCISTCESYYETSTSRTPRVGGLRSAVVPAPALGASHSVCTRRVKGLFHRAGFCIHLRIQKPPFPIGVLSRVVHRGRVSGSVQAPAQPVRAAATCRLLRQVHQLFGKRREPSLAAARSGCWMVPYAGVARLASSCARCFAQAPSRSGCTFTQTRPCHSLSSSVPDCPGILRCQWLLPAHPASSRWLVTTSPRR
jgi:hypothetical protein